MAIETNSFKDYLGTLPQQSNVDSIMAKDANGNPIWIKKADLAQVAAELIPVATVKKKGLMSSNDKLYMPIEVNSDNVLLATLLDNGELSFLVAMTTYSNAIGGIYIFSFLYKDGSLQSDIICLNKNDILKNSIYYEETSSNAKIYLKRGGVICSTFLLAKGGGSELNNLNHEVPLSATLLY